MDIRHMTERSHHLIEHHITDMLEAALPEGDIDLQHVSVTEAAGTRVIYGIEYVVSAYTRFTVAQDSGRRIAAGELVLRAFKSDVNGVTADFDPEERMVTLSLRQDEGGGAVHTAVVDTVISLDRADGRETSDTSFRRIEDAFRDSRHDIVIGETFYLRGIGHVRLEPVVLIDEAVRRRAVVDTL